MGSARGRTCHVRGRRSPGTHGRDRCLARIYGLYTVPATIKLDIDAVLTTKYDARYPVSVCYQPTKRQLLRRGCWRWAAVAKSPPWSTSPLTVSLASHRFQMAISSPLSQPVITGPPTHSVGGQYGFARWRLSSSETLHGGAYAT